MIKELEFYKFPVSVIRKLDMLPVIQNTVCLESYGNELLNQMVYKLSAYVLAEEVDCRSKVVNFKAVFPVYKNWWEHFKGEVFTEWLKEKFPPKFNYVTKTEKRKVTFRKYATYPQANILFPEKMGEKVVYRSYISEEVK